MTERTFDWRSRHDPRSKNYPMATVLRQRDIPVEEKFWEEGIVLDQGSEGACVGFAWTGELLAEPEAPRQQPEVYYANNLAKDFYHEAKKIDEWPGENYDGTSVLAGAQIMQRMGFIGEYRWCFKVDQIRKSILSEGPVVIGIPWFDGMYNTGPGGLVRVSGKSTGGHAILLTGYSPKMKFGNSYHEVFRWRNSWGKAYGVGGSGFIKVGDLANLLSQGGEACVPMQREIPVFNKPKRNIFARLFKKFGSMILSASTKTT